MSRTVILALAVAAGLGVGWWRTAAQRRVATAALAQARAQQAALAAAPARPPRHEFPLRPADVQADRETPAIATDAKGRVLVAFASQAGELERTLYLARSADGGATFDEPKAWRKVPIFKYASKSRGGKPAMTYSTHVLPRLASSGEEIALGWVEAIDGGPKVVYYVARTVDGGATFSEPAAVHGPGASKPGFTALAAGPSGELDAAWLDGRGGGQKPFASTRRPGSAGFDAEVMVTEGPEGAGVCPCCDMALARGEGGPLFFAYRDNDGDLRDIRVARGSAGGAGFEPPVAVGDHRWKFPGCPHDGPALAVAGGRLVVAWMDAHEGPNRLYVADSDLDALAFTPRRLDGSTPGAQGHPKLAVAPSGRVIAVWDESLDAAPTAPPSHEHGHGAAMSGAGRAVRIATSADGRTFAPSRAIDARPGAFQVNPSVSVLADGTAVVAWSELDVSGKRMVVARVKP